jgi:hypothetical protein
MSKHAGPETDVIGAGPLEVTASLTGSSDAWMVPPGRGLFPDAARALSAHAEYWNRKFSADASRSARLWSPDNRRPSRPPPELVEHGQTGLLFDPQSADDLADDVAWAERHPDEMADMGDRARAEYEGRVHIGQELPGTDGIYAQVFQETPRLGNGACFSSQW